MESLRERLRSDGGSGLRPPPPPLADGSGDGGGGGARGRTREEEEGGVDDGDGDDVRNEDDFRATLEAIRTSRRDRLFPPSSSSSVLTDSHGRDHSYLRISLGERCNLRCRYCMPPEGVPLQRESKLLTTDEIGRLIDLFAREGVDKVRLTGGEPLLRKDLPEIVSLVSSIPTIRSVGITTNALTLSRRLPSLIESGLTHANVSLDTLVPEKFLEITRRNGLDKVLRAVDDAAEGLGGGKVKINCVVMKGFNDDELIDFANLTERRTVDVRFIEWMPFGDNGWNADRFYSYRDMLSNVRGEGDAGSESGGGAAAGGGGDGDDGDGLDLVRDADGPNDTTKWYRVPSHLGRVGFITSMSSNFCSNCNRLRITADGNLKVCLFGGREVSLRDAMRAGATDGELREVIGAAVRKKTYALGGHGNAEGIRRANDNRPMTLIGG